MAITGYFSKIYHSAVGSLREAFTTNPVFLPRKKSYELSSFIPDYVAGRYELSPLSKGAIDLTSTYGPVFLPRIFSSLEWMHIFNLQTRMLYSTGYNSSNGLRRSFDLS